jgi:hypothetical protein
MKNFLRIAMISVALSLVPGNVSMVFAQDDPIVGGYGDASTSDPDVIKAANFAVKSRSQRQGVSISLVSIQRAGLQVVAGINYALDLKVRINGNARDVKAVIYRNLRNNYSLTSWEVVASSQLTLAYRITAIKAMLFYDDKGTFSRDVLAKPAFTFWNTIIGEGDAEGPSNSTLVLVEIAGNPSRNEPLPLRKVEFTATSSRRVVLQRTADIGLFGDDGKFYAAFWLYDTGCQPVRIAARILGQKQASSLKATIPFACGE